MNKLKQLRKEHRLRQIERRLNFKDPVISTVTYHENGAHRQIEMVAATEEELMKKVFNFEIKNFPARQVKTVQYQGITLNWSRASTYAHYWLGKGRMSFEEFKEACFDEKVRATA